MSPPHPRAGAEPPGPQTGRRSTPAALRQLPALLLALVAIGLTAALANPAPPAVVGIALAAAAALLALALTGGRAGLAVAVAALLCLLLGITVGGLRLAATAPGPAVTPGWSIGTISIDSPPVPVSGGRWRARAVVEELSLPGGEGPPPSAGSRLLLHLPAGVPPAIGSRLRVAGPLAAPAQPDAPAWWRRWLERQAIVGALRVRHSQRLGARGGLVGLRDRWRNWAAGAAGVGLSGDTRAVVRGLALGGGALLSEETQRQFRESGIWHLLAVSGQNITLVALAVLFLLRAGGLSRPVTLWGAMALLIAYCLACDGGPSVARAGVMGALGLLGQLRSAAGLAATLLCGGAVAILSWQPRALWDPGFQLSFAAVAGLLLIAPRLEYALAPWIGGRIAGLAALAAAAALATAPVLAANFGTISPAGLLVNLVAVPLAGPVVVLALCGIAGAALHSLAAALPALAAGAGADLLRLVARVGSAPEWATVAVPRWSALPLAAVALAATAPSAWWAAIRRRRQLAIALAGAAVAVGAICWPRAALAPWPQRPAITALAIGQGDAILLRSPAGAALLIDAGPAAVARTGDPPIVAALARHGVERLDGLLVTHGDADHVGGAHAVLERLRVGALITGPAGPDDGPLLAAVRITARARGVTERNVARGARLQFGSWTVAVLHPRAPAALGRRNEHSIVARAEADGLSVLLTGDAESAALAGVDLPRVRVLKVAHHGSADPGLPALLSETEPALALISAGAGNPFGHPDPTVLTALAAAGVSVARTDREGDRTILAAARPGEPAGG